MMTLKSSKGKIANRKVLQSALSFLLAVRVSHKYVNAQPWEIKLVPSINAKPFWAVPVYWKKTNVFMMDSIVMQLAKV